MPIPIPGLPEAAHHLMHMPLYQAGILGVLQGLAEFAPISSSAHLVLVPWLFGPVLKNSGWIEDPGQAFDAALHIGTAIALIGYFWADWKRILSAWFDNLAHRNTWADPDVRMAWLIIIASIPGAIFGMVFEKPLDTLFDVDHHPWAPAAIAGLLAVAGLLLWASDRRGKKSRHLSNITRGNALLIGCSQVLALFPGVSRSGATITAGLALGLTRQAAARFSFLMAAPITLGAGLLKVASMRHATEPHPQASALILGVALSAVVGWAVIHWLLGYLQKQTMNLFVVYRVIFAALVFVVWITRH